jgi:hypothetical protein
MMKTRPYSGKAEKTSRGSRAQDGTIVDGNTGTKKQTAPDRRNAGRIQL